MELKWRNDGHKWAVIEVIAEKKPKKWDDDGIENCETYMQITIQGAQIVVSSQPCIESYLYNLLSFLKNEK